MTSDTQLAGPFYTSETQLPAPLCPVPLMADFPPSDRLTLPTDFVSITVNHTHVSLIQAFVIANVVSLVVLIRLR